MDKHIHIWLKNRIPEEINVLKSHIQRLEALILKIDDLQDVTISNTSDEYNLLFHHLEAFGMYDSIKIVCDTLETIYNDLEKEV